MAIIETRLPTRVERGFSVVPARFTDIVALRSGVEYRNARWSSAKRRFSGRYGNWTREMRDELLAVWMACEGPTYAFRFKDHNDFDVTAQSLGTTPAGSTPVQLVKTYTFGSRTHTRTITKPVAGTVTVYQNGVAKAGTLDTATGLFTPSTTWTAAQPLTWTGEFDVPVRFASDEIEFVLPDRAISEVNVELVEVFGE